ncbi:MAG: LamG domain-containing protein, partial [Propionicimonas sp.]
MNHLTRAASGVLALSTLLLTTSLSASAATMSGTDTRPVSSRILSSASPFYQKLPADAPAAADSSMLVTSLNQQAHDFYGTATDANVGMNTVTHTPPMYVALSTDPLQDVASWSCQASSSYLATMFNENMQDINIPVDALADGSDDGGMTIYNADTKELVELWKARKVDGQWQACWGGRIRDADQSLGAFSGTWGMSASGMAMWATTIRASEIAAGRIDHVIGMSIPFTKSTISAPAVRTDGWRTGTELSIGQMLRLPASLDIDAMTLSPLARTIAKAAQEYGIIITDTGGSVAFSAENANGMATNPYPSLFRNRYAFQELQARAGLGEAAFPLDQLVALPMDYTVAVATPTPDPTATPTPTPTPTPAADYPTTVKAANPALYWRLNETTSAVGDSSGNGNTGTMTTVYRSAPGAITGDTSVSTYGNDKSLVYSSAQLTPADAFTVQTWFKTGTGKGGKLAGLEKSQLGIGSSSDRSLYMLNDGRLAFGTLADTAMSVVSIKKYNDGAWHMATATQSGTGTTLYVDAIRVATTTATGAGTAPGYWRLGGGNLAAWPNQPTSAYFAGALDEFAVYNSALSSATVTAQF